MSTSVSEAVRKCRDMLERVARLEKNVGVVSKATLENDPAIVTANTPIGNARAAYLVRFRDLRYDYPGRDARAMLGATVFLTHDLQVVEERFGMGSRHQGRNRE